MSKKILCLIIFVFIVFQIHVKVNAENKLGYLFLIDPAHPEYLQKIQPMIDIKIQQGFDARVEKFPKDKDFNADNIRSFLRELKIGIPENKPPIMPTWSDLENILLIGDFPRKGILKNEGLNPDYFPSNVQLSDFFYSFLKEKELNVDNLNVKKFFKLTPDVYIGRILGINDQVIKNWVESQKIVYFNPSILYAAPILSFPTKEGSQRHSNGADWSIPVNFSAEVLGNKGFNKVVKLYETEGNKISFNSPTATVNRQNFFRYFNDSPFLVTLTSSDRNNEEDYKSALFLRSVWRDLNHDGIAIENLAVQKGEISTEVLASVDDLDKMSNLYGRIWVSLFKGIFGINEKNIFFNEKTIASVINGGIYFYSSVDNPDDGWQATTMYCLLDQLAKGSTIGEAVFNIPQKYSHLVKEDQWELMPAWTIASLIILGDPSYRPLDHLKPYSTQVPNTVDLGFHCKGEFTITNLSSAIVVINIKTETPWINLKETKITLGSKEEKQVQIETQIAFPFPVHILKLPINRYGEIKVTVEGEKSQRIRVIAKM